MGLNSADSPGLDWIYSTQLFGIKLGLEAPARLIREFAGFDPARPPFAVIHVAGTNGKGSTCAFAERLLRQAGLRTGLFTSPHLLHFSERIQVKGQAIPRDLLERDLAELRALVADWQPHPTFFELTLALALRHFIRAGVEVVVLETGMGGRLDATNAIAKQLAAITPIGMDHAQWLGPTVEKIAAEKAGIFQRGAAALSAAQVPEVATVLRARAAELGAEVVVVAPLAAGVELGLLGAHQRQNAALALAAVRALGVELAEAEVAQALAQTRWPGRFELHDNGQIIVDGAHNEPAAAVLAQTWREQFGSRKALLICGLVDKDAAAILRHWLPLVAEAWFVPVASPRSSDPESLAELWRREGGQRAEAKADLASALAEARRRPEKILIAGSLFLVAEALALSQGREGPRDSAQ